MNIILKKLIYIILLLALAGCNTRFKNKESIPLASAYGNILYLSDIEGLIPVNITPRDSIEFVRSFVNDWLRTNVLIYQAENNLPPEQLNFSRQLENYRNSLIIYEYETNLINQTLDTVVTEEEITDYYNTNQSNFELKENITKASYIIVENLQEAESTFDSLFKLADSVKFDSIEYYTEIYKAIAKIDTSKWESFISIQEKIPIETYNRELFLKNNRFIKIKNESFIYYLEIFDFKIKDDISPIEFKIKDIKNVIISKRKIKLAKKVREDIYNRAVLNKDIEIYYQE